MATDMNPYTTEMGKALCDRLGLNHDTTLREWKAETVGGNRVAVSMTTMVFMPIEDYNDLEEVARQRANTPVMLATPPVPAALPAIEAPATPEVQQ